MKKKVTGSTIALIIGVVLILGVSYSPHYRKTSLFVVGTTLTLGALAYKSAEKRKLGMVTATKSRLFLEGLAMFFIIAIVLLTTDVMRNDPISNPLIPLLVMIIYFRINLRKLKTND